MTDEEEQELTLLAERLVAEDGEITWVEEDDE
jgi:hypothetical protein